MSHHQWTTEHGLSVQDRQNNLDAVRATRERTTELLRDHGRVVDVGCGTGTGVRALGERAIGVDTSADMLRLAASRSAVVCQAKAEALPLPTASFGGARFDRVLYHLAQPELALAEGARILHSGGRLVCAHPDHESLVIEVPRAPQHLVALAKQTRIDLNYMNGTVPRRIPRMLVDLGFTEVRTEAFTLIVDDPDEPSISLPSWLRSWRQLGQVDLTDGELVAWDEAIDDARKSGGYLFALTYLVTFGDMT
jgi:SAM-dependent methyltransferase